jgi:hypothetical protein
MFRALATLPLLAALALAIAPADAAANGSLGSPITGPQLDALWAIDVDVEIVRVGAPDEQERTVLPRHRATVPDGHAMSLHSVVRTDRGQQEFSLAVTPHHHPGDTVELEWALEVTEARYRPIDVASYLLHRLQLDDVLELDEAALAIARADIVAVHDEPHRKQVVIGGELHEIRIFARAARG